MGFARLVVASVLYPTLVAVLILTGLVAYATIFAGRDSAPHHWNANKHVHTDGLTFTSVETNGVRLNVIEAGDRASSSSKKLAVLLHGFPETALLSWHELIPVLVAEGYFVVAPDQRGYNQSAKPESVEAYYIDHLADDVKGLLDHYGYAKAVVIGHDWGAAVAWWFAQRHPEAVEKLVVMNVPHGRAFKEHLSSSLSQLMKSWYVFYFQLPYLPELKLAHNNYSFLQGIPAGSGIVGKTFPLDSLPRYLQAWSEPGALTGMLNWYRATLRYAKRANGVDPTIRVPTQIIWGKKDIALDAEMVEKSLAFCAPGMCKATYFDDATHWVQHDEPEKVAHLLTSFLRS
jgi:pimeloyl-ACP methyl ester carboxylesterase